MENIEKNNEDGIHDQTFDDDLSYDDKKKPALKRKQSSVLKKKQTSISPNRKI